MSLLKAAFTSMFDLVLIVYGDGATVAMQGMVTERVELCGGQLRGSAYVRNAWEEYRIAYNAVYYSDGATTFNPDSMEELVIIEDYDLVFSAGDFEACEVYGDTP
jgi:hypothetical protein